MKTGALHTQFKYLFILFSMQAMKHQPWSVRKVIILTSCMYGSKLMSISYMPDSGRPWKDFQKRIKLSCLKVNCTHHHHLQIQILYPIKVICALHCSYVEKGAPTHILRLLMRFVRISFISSQNLFFATYELECDWTKAFAHEVLAAFGCMFFSLHTRPIFQKSYHALN